MLLCIPEHYARYSNQYGSFALKEYHRARELFDNIENLNVTMNVPRSNLRQFQITKFQLQTKTLQRAN